MGLCQALFNLYTKEDFTDIISIGTSASRIGSLLSFLLSVKHQSTFADAQIRGEVASRKDYTEYEKFVLISPNARVLIIDDILGMGSVVEKVVKKFAGLNKPPERIRAFCLYALGDLRETSKKLSELKIDYLAAFPDVIYAKEDSHSRTCEICNQRPHIIQDE